MQNTALRSELAAINEMAASRHVTAQDIASLRGQVSSAEGTRDAFKATLSNFRTARDTINLDLSEINSAFSSGAVTLSSVSYSGSSITITGTGNSEDAVFSCAKELRASGRFSLVVINSINDKGSFTFTLTK
jgi:imidazolonepropionase-like amidohydrolase